MRKVDLFLKTIPIVAVGVSIFHIAFKLVTVANDVGHAVNLKNPSRLKITCLKTYGDIYSFFSRSIYSQRVAAWNRAGSFK